MAAGPRQPLVSENHAIVIRRSTPADAEMCGRMCFDAFGTLANKHNFRNDFPAVEIAIHVPSTMFSRPLFFCVVAGEDGKVVGSNCLDERTPLAGVAACARRTPANFFSVVRVSTACRPTFLFCPLGSIVIGLRDRVLTLWADHQTA